MALAQWLKNPLDVDALLNDYTSSANDSWPIPPTSRKLRLFAVGCARVLWRVEPERCWAPDAIEQFADETKHPEREQIQGLRERLHAERSRRQTLDEGKSNFSFEPLVWRSALRAAFETKHFSSKDENAEMRRVIFRDIFRNPFWPVTLDPTWLTPTVVTLANGIYNDRAFDRMPILADALEEAGCDNADVLLHCRGDGPHVKGCWVVDLVLGKE